MSAYLHALRLRTEGWHGDAEALGLGFILDGETPTEAATICGMIDYRYEQIALYRMVRSGQVTRNDDGTFTITNSIMERHGKTDLITVKPDGTRLPIDRIVGWYDPLQPEDLVRILDPLAKQMQLEGLGILGKNAEIMYVQFRLPSYDIGGDEHHAYYTVGDDKSMGGIHQGTTHVRVVCNNTWSAATSDLPVFGHSDSEFTVDACTKVMAATLRSREREIELMNILFKTPYDRDARKEYAEYVFPDPPKPAKVELAEAAMTALPEKEATRIAERVEGQKRAYETNMDFASARRLHLFDEIARFNDSMPQAADTGYALFNAMTAMARPDRDVRDAEGRKMFAGDPVNRMANALFGRGVNGLAVARAHEWLESSLS